MLILALTVACRQPSDDDLVADDTSYQFAPVLVEIGTECDADDRLIVSARTRGWHEGASVDLWSDPADPSDPAHQTAPLVSVGFRADEWCDVMRTDPLPNVGGFTCAALADYTLFVRVDYEEGCAGCAASGPKTAAIADSLTLSHLPHCPTAPDDPVTGCSAYEDPATPLTVTAGSVSACHPI